LSGKMRIFLLQAGKHFDPAVVDVLLRIARRKGLIE
jgi:HD-GYP domain-containing protein (c-di-GMP phosphodiesterase class II)